jgi:hypothetical protein
MENRLKRKLADGTLTFCLGVNQARTPNITMIAAAAGFDAIYVDLEHNPTSLETASMLCVAAISAGITPMVRIGSQDGHLAARVLDGGAQGLMVPHINSAAEAEAIVTACRLPPIGHRSVGGAGPALGYHEMPQAEVSDSSIARHCCWQCWRRRKRSRKPTRLPPFPASMACISGRTTCAAKWEFPAGITIRTTCTRLKRPAAPRETMANRWGSAACCSITSCRPNWFGSAPAI